MASWWENDPVAPDSGGTAVAEPPAQPSAPAAQSGGNWWESDPVATDSATPPAPGAVADQSQGEPSVYDTIRANQAAAAAQGTDPYQANVERGVKMQAENAPDNAFTAVEQSYLPRLASSAVQGAGEAAAGTILTGLAQVNPKYKEAAEYVYNQGRSREATNSYLNAGSTLKNAIQGGVDILAQAAPAASLGPVGMAAYFGGATGAKTLTEAEQKGDSVGSAYAQAATHGTIDAAWTFLGSKFLGSTLGKLAGMESDSLLSRAAGKLTEKIPLPSWSKTVGEVAGGASGQVMQGIGMSASHYIADTALTNKQFDRDEFIQSMESTILPSLVAGLGGEAIHALPEALPKIREYIGKVADTVKERVNELPKAVEEHKDYQRPKSATINGNKYTVTENGVEWEKPPTTDAEKWVDADLKASLNIVDAPAANTVVSDATDPALTEAMQGRPLPGENVPSRQWATLDEARQRQAAKSQNTSQTPVNTDATTDLRPDQAAATEDYIPSQVTPDAELAQKPEAPIVQYRRDAQVIEQSLPPVPEGHTRLWRGNRKGESGRRFTNDLPGIALPFRKHYAGELAYLDIPTGDLAKYEDRGGAAPGAEFTLPREVADSQHRVEQQQPTPAEVTPPAQPVGAEPPSSVPPAAIDENLPDWVTHDSGYQDSDGFWVGPTNTVEKPKPNEKARTGLRKEVNQLKRREVLSTSDVDLLQSLDHHEQRAILDQATDHAADVNQHREQVRSDYKSLVGNTTGNRARLREMRGLDYTKIPGFNNKIQQLENGSYPALAAEAMARGKGDLSQGLFDIMRDGAKQFNPVPPDQRIGEILNEYRQAKEAASSSGIGTDSEVPGASSTGFERVGVREDVSGARSQEVPQAEGAVAPFSLARGESPDKSPVTPQYSAPDSARLPEPAAKERQPLMEGMPTDMQPGTLEGQQGLFQAERSPTSIKNATVDQEREQRGLPPAMEPLKRSFGEVWDSAMAEIERNPRVTDDLLDSLRAKPRALTDREDALLLHRQVDLQNQFDESSQAFLDAQHSGNDADAVSERARLAVLSDSLLDLYNVGKKVGTETGRGLNARKMLANEDFSLAKMVNDKRVANGGRELTPEEHTQIAELQKKLAETQKAFEEHQAAWEDKRRDLETTNTLLRIVREVKGEKPKPPEKGVIRKFLSDRAEEARARIKARGVHFGAGIDPIEAADYAIIGADYLAQGVEKFADWSKSMAKDFGERIKPHLQFIFNKAKEARTELEARAGDFVKKRKPKDIGERIKGRIADGESPAAAIGSDAQKLARAFVEQGITEREPLIDAVHKVLKEVDPTITRRDTMDAISGYGQYKLLSKDEVSTTLRDLKGQMQQAAKLEDMIDKGVAPKKTGIERRETSDTERRLIKQVNETKKKLNIQPVDPETQLRSALDGVKTRLRNTIADLEHQIDTKVKIVKDKSPVPRDDEAKQLETRRDEFKKQFDDIFGKPELTDQQRIDLAKKAIKRSIFEYERRIASKEFVTPDKVSKTPETDELKADRSKRDALREQFKELQKLDPVYQAKTDERSLQAFKTATANRIADLQDKLANGDYSKPQHREIPRDDEAQRLKASVERLRDQWRQGLLKDRMKRRPLPIKFMDSIARWRRGFVLSSPTTLVKLLAAASERIVSTPLEEAVGAGYSKAFPSLAKRAPREGYLSTKAEAASITDGVMKGMAEAGRILKYHKSDLDAAYGKEYGMPRSAMDIFGEIHAALKNPAKRGEFARSFQKRAEFAMRAGLDPYDPIVQTRLSVESYKDANRAIFMQDNAISNRVKLFLAARPKAGEEFPSFRSKLFETAGKVAMPIVKIPTNFVAETFTHAVGSVTGSINLGKAYAKGIENLKPEEADHIMRNLKKGSLGLAMLSLGYFGAGSIGGYYQPGKRDDKDVKFGRVKVFGYEVPNLLLHHPLLEVLQLGATIRRVQDSRLRKKDTDTQGLPAGVMAGALGLTEEVPFVRETVDIGKVFDANERPSELRRMAGDYAVPQAVSQAAKYFDKDASGETVRRKPTSIGEGIKENIPGLRKSVPLAKPPKSASGPLKHPKLRPVRL